MTGIPFKGWFTAKTAKAKKCKRIDEDDFDEVAAVHVQPRWKEASVFGEKLKKGSNYLVKKERHSNVFSAWKRAMASQPREKNKNSGEVSSSGDSSSCLESRSCHKTWNTKTGREIKSESTPLAFPKLFEASPSMFVNELAPPTPATLYGGKVARQSRDPALIFEEAIDSSVPTNHVTLNVTAGNAWEETRNRTTINEILTKSFSRFKLEKKTKVKKVQI